MSKRPISRSVFVTSPSLSLVWHLEHKIPLLRQKWQTFIIFGIYKLIDYAFGFIFIFLLFSLAEDLDGVDGGEVVKADLG